MIFLLACAQKDDDVTTDRPPGATADVITSVVTETTTDRNGTATIDVEVTSPTDVFQVLVRRNRGLADIEQIYDPDGNLVLDWEDWYDSDYQLTECFYPMEFAATCNWPVRAQDGPLAVGTWQVVVASIDNGYNYDPRADIDVEVLRRTDPAFDTGTLHAVIAYANGVRDEDGVVDAVEAAAAYWTELYAAVGITLTVEYADIDVDAAMPDTYQGEEAYAELMEGRDDRAVLMVIGETIAGDSYTYGEAGGIPGPYGPADHGAVEVAWLANAGSDARFSDSDIALMGETMAHEVGHYLGLFHPIDYNYDYTEAQWWDSLDDTEDCSGWERCDTLLGSNLMYPYPVCDGMQSSTCIRQDQLTSDQGGVLNRYVGVE